MQQIARIPILYRYIALGVLLALGQILLFFLGYPRPGINLALNNTFLPGLLLYLLIPVFAGLQRASKGDEQPREAGAGLVTGSVSALIVMLTLITAFFFVHPQSSGRFLIPVEFIIGIIFVAALVYHAFCGILLAVIGAAVGRLIRKRFMKQVASQ